MHISVNQVGSASCVRLNLVGVEKKKNPGQLFREQRERSGITQGELAAKAGVSPATVQNVENPVWAARSGRSLLKLGTLLKVARGLGIDEATARKEWELIRDTHASAAKDDNVNREVERNIGTIEDAIIEVPEYDLPPSASHWSELTGAEDQSLEHDPLVIEQGLFRVRIHGDCMEPQWLDNDLIEFRIWRQGGKDPMPIGQDVALTNSDGMTTFKRLLRYDSPNDEIVLKALNPKYPEEMRVPAQMVSRIAVALHVLMKRK